jgi:hypothetical protein
MVEIQKRLSGDFAVLHPGRSLLGRAVAEAALRAPLYCKS